MGTCIQISQPKISLKMTKWVCSLSITIILDFNISFAGLSEMARLSKMKESHGRYAIKKYQ
ncbi:hypothetical protein BpHYR1_027967 [Brachionus plicatilis]|uniref:Uncharacterized protein n=1 Tax=Brachionus plicatilis TaxID=10195 RepID=A0A3M7QUN8_BRAPC|nr:hypothetical protein BpHYR1_027967 [Brachionus plicatilis]